MKNLNNNKILTVIIVLYKEPFELIKRTIEKIKDFKIIIIDNDCNKDLKDKILKQFYIYKYILNKKNIGFSAGYNQGIKMIDTLYTLVLGPDCLIKKEDISILINSLDLYKDSIMVTPTSYNDKNELTYAGGPLPENSEKDIVLNLEGDTCVESALGACLLFKTEDFKLENLSFDENFFLYFSDDDLCRNIKSLNRSIIQIKKAKCIHQHGIIKIKNKFYKIYVREFNFNHDMFYYFYKKKGPKYFKIINDFKKKIPKYFIKILIMIFLFRLKEVVKLYARLLAFYKFKKKYLNL